MQTDIYTQLVEKIIKEQETIIGPVAWEQAAKVQGITIDLKTQAVSLHGDKKEIIDTLVTQYKELFGQVSIEVCKEAVKDLLSNTPKEQVPKILQ